MANSNFNDIPYSALALNRRNENRTVEREITFDANNYLNVKLAPEDHGKKELRIRLLPMDMETGNPFLKIYQHNVKVPHKEIAPSGYKSYICLSRTNIDHEKFGTKCPFCEINQEAYNKAKLETNPTLKKQWTDLSLANRAREGVICRCIDRAHPEQGVKFWKFNISLKEDDPYNQIMNLWESRAKEGAEAGSEINILSLVNGYDLIVTISEGGENTKGNTITITDAKFSTPLSNDRDQFDAWVNDSKKWDDVFKVKDYNYLSVISIGDIPWFDRNNKCWIPKSEYDAAVNARNNEQSQAISRADEAFKRPVNDFASRMELPDNEDMPL